MTPPDQTGPNYSDLARIVVSRARTAREGVELVAALIAAHGESTYGGNSHLFADPDEAWVMIQFAGGKGLWVAERLGPESIRASRPGYITHVPVDQPDYPDFMYSDNLVAFAREQGWYDHGPFDANRIYGDGKGRWNGVTWIEDEMTKRAARPEKIGFADLTWAVRTSRLTSDTAGYGQIVPLVHPEDDPLRVLWHAPIGAVAAPFSPVFIGQSEIPDEFRLHRYLTRGESAAFMDDRTLSGGESAPASMVSQSVERSRSAVAECKRLFYLMLADEDRYLAEVTEAFEAREAWLAAETARVHRTAAALLTQDSADLTDGLLTYFSSNELLRGLDMVRSLADGIAARERYRVPTISGERRFRSFEQVW